VPPGGPHPATGVAGGARILGPEEIADLLARAGERDEMLRQAQRIQAEFENYRRRQEKDARRSAEDEAARVLAPFLDALDSFTRAVEAAERTRDFETLLEGVRIAARETERALGELGVQRIDAAGQVLDPSLHQAVMQEPTEDHPPLTVLQVLASGWRRGDRVIRPARVKVAVPPTPPSAATGGSVHPTEG